MTTRPSSIRNLAWAVIGDGAEPRHVYRRGVDLFLRDGRIVEITPAGARPLQANEPALDGSGMLALPGLINIHSHPTTEPAYRGVREDHGVPEQHMTGLIERLQAFRLDNDGQSAAAVMSYSEMLRAGTTTVCDVTAPFDGWLDTMVQSGMRFYAGPTFASARWGMSAPQTVTWRWDEAAGLAAFDKAKAVMAEAESHNSGRLGALVFPAQIDTVTPELFAAARRHADETGRRFSTHIGQAVVEVREMIRRHGTTPVQWAAAQGLLKPDTILAHCILLDEHPQIRWHTARDLDLIAEVGASVAHCPQPFARYGLAMDHVGRYRTRGVNIGLGTDCAPHNLVEEMRLAIHAARLMSETLASLDSATAFEAATIGGARALGRDDIGRLAPGMLADIVLVDLAHPLMQPARDPLRSYVFHAADRAVRTVLVGGEVVLQDGAPLHLDPAAAMERLAEAQARMLRDAPNRDYAHRPAEEIAPLSLPVV
ncbi:MAG: amidohydrolase family protein [Reyranella sp.]|uniref:amidohydrolase family protein n=1 Tax=Reyranella sp. TaxID=1929291 RepID=UPI003D12314C